MAPPAFSQLQSPEVKLSFYFMGNYLGVFFRNLDAMKGFLRAA